MTRPEPRSLLEHHRPDYAGGGIVNLMSTLIAARGGQPETPTLTALPPARLADTRNLVLLVIDGLGADWLRRHAPEGLLARHRIATLSTVFPATTAAAITTYLTGDAPLRHGLTGWHTYLRELGCVMAVLPGTPRYGGVSYARAGIDPARLFGTRPVFDRIATRSSVIAPQFIIDSDFNRAHSGQAERLGFQGLDDMFGQAARVIRAAPWRPGRRRHDAAPRYLYLYWPRLDTIGHQQGIESAAAVGHLAQIEAALARFLEQITGTDTQVLVCADHGQVDSTPETRVDLDDHPELAECLALPLCGEPRAAFCYLRSGRERQFLDYCEAHLAERVEVVPSNRLIELGMFGSGERNPRLAERIGDYCLLARDNAIVVDRLPNERPHPVVGVHGGLSRAELEVPLALLRPD
ncbi:alkaline phosphatase family protein [Marichromatium sp. AB32]|uniref:alkaline phosphatase family protein n=1 Tax=Marichromatium sp. AB32 TaxID=2483363 RepID=UPI000F415422|nr:alkaline phosphatase family protein [Marichromatium sp. AB32]MBO8085855.1 alkaline phosphatase family protein [Marichromatium sp.]RNE93208.1 phosphodiesterase [Marichromatium sp. AB32]